MARVIDKLDSFRFSHSKLKLWLKCKMAYHLKYVEKLRAKRKSRPLQFGTMVHEMLEAWINGDDPFEVLAEFERKQGKLFATMVEEYGDIVDDTRIIMSEYFDYWDEQAAKHPENKLVFVRKNKRGAEHKFEVEVRPNVLLIGKIDAVAKAKKLRWMVEHKTFTQMPNEDHRWRNVQSAIYLRVNDMLGWEPLDGTLWDYVHSKSPAFPQVLKDGSLGKRSLNTLPTRILEVLEREGLSQKKYAHLLTSASENRGHYFQRIFNPKKRKVIDALWADMMATVDDMVERHGRVQTRTIERHCEWCEYEPICRAALQGSDVDFVKEREFYVDKEDHSKDWEDAIQA